MVKALIAAPNYTTRRKRVVSFYRKIYSPRTAKILAETSGKRACIKAEVLRNALSLLFAAHDARDEGLHIGAWGQDDETRIEREFVTTI